MATKQPPSSIDEESFAGWLTREDGPIAVAGHRTREAVVVEDDGHAIAYQCVDCRLAARQVATFDAHECPEAVDE